MTNATNYGTSPWLGLAATSSVDPAGLNLTDSSSYETPGTAWLRPLTSTKPAGAATTSTNTYYGGSQSYGAALSIASPVCGLPVATPQYGMLKTSTGPTNSSGAAIATTSIYDIFGRLVGQKSISDTDWTCTFYDTRGRTTKTTTPAIGGTARTATVSYSSTGTYDVNGNPIGDPLTTWSQDDGVTGSPTSGRITTISDLLGQAKTYTDVWATVTTNTYNILGQLTVQASTPAGQATKKNYFSYDMDGRLVGVAKESPTAALASVIYVNGRPVQIAYPGGSTGVGSNVSGTIGYDAAGRQQSLGWDFSGTQNDIVDTAIRSQSGRILRDTLTDGSTSYPSTYSYDAAGRLVSAAIPHHQLTYGYASTGGCGTNTAAGADGNRTGVSDSLDGAAASSTSFCNDNADRLTATTLTNPVPGGDQLASTPISTSTSGITSHAYSTPGTYTVGLTETDSTGATAQTSHSVTVVAADRGPVAVFTSAASNLTATFAASGSSDPDGTVAGYAWAFGDGTTGTGVSTSHTYAVAGTYAVTLTATDNLGATATIDHQVAVAGAFGADTFARTVSNGWGTATTGGAWAVAPAATQFSVAAGIGKITAAPFQTSAASLGSVSTSDTDVTVGFSLDSMPTASSYTKVLGRQIGTSAYSGEGYINSAGAVILLLEQGSTTLRQLTIPGLVYTAGTKLKLHVRVTGTSPTTVQASLWQASATEPATWQLSTTDSTAGLQAAESIGVALYESAASTAPITASFTNLVASPSAAPAASTPFAARFTTSTIGSATTVDASSSTDAGGTITAWAWTFGDGTSSSGANLAYDAHGNTTVLGDQTMTYDASDRHLSSITTGAGGATITYQRDVTDRIVSMTTTAGGTTTAVRYSFSGGGDSPDWTLSPTGSVLEHTLALPGGVVVSIQAGGATWVWSYPNIHGDVIVTSTGGGTRTGTVNRYDPFGQPINPTTNSIGTTTADSSVPNNTTQPVAGYGWEGSHQKLYQHAADIATIEMGARQYVPGLGRFLEVDPVAGGNVAEPSRVSCRCFVGGFVG
ncbi:PKD domain-containing protein [Glaciihabitans sp. UYNi722]|uniref:PKD domain-containing protein n=1 Tax=Glaciihabitans sp. UYNi722 TaxID=3156344 RepID=UPI00339A4E0B